MRRIVAFAATNPDRFAVCKNSEKFLKLVVKSAVSMIEAALQARFMHWLDT
jgi:hypothetical protein